jgi:hypothetical protein
MFASIVLADPGQKVEKRVTIAPSDVIEKCLKLQPDQTLKYSFMSSKPLKFNLHYHLKEKTVFHIKEETSSRSEVFHPVKDQNVYCMEWKNPHSDGAELKYEYISE